MDRPSVFFHVTLTKNLASILDNGLIAQSGERSQEINDYGIFIFPNENEMDNALSNWLGESLNDQYGEDIEVSSLMITLPDDFPVSPIFVNGEESFEWYTQSNIPACFVRFHKEQ